MRAVKRLSLDTRGGALIEFAMVLPVVAVMLLGIVDVATCYSQQFSLQQAAGRSLERVQVTGGRTDLVTVRAEAAQAANVPISSVTVDDWLECDSQRQATSVQQCSTGQTTARYVQVTINSKYVPFFAYSPLGARQADGTVALSVNSALRVS